MTVCLAASESIPPVHPMNDAHVDAAISSWNELIAIYQHVIIQCNHVTIQCDHVIIQCQQMGEFHPFE